MDDLIRILTLIAMVIKLIFTIVLCALLISSPGLFENISKLDGVMFLVLAILWFDTLTKRG